MATGYYNIKELTTLNLATDISFGVQLIIFHKKLSDVHFHLLKYT